MRYSASHQGPSTEPARIDQPQIEKCTGMDKGLSEPSFFPLGYFIKFDISETFRLSLREIRGKLIDEHRIHG